MSIDHHPAKEPLSLPPPRPWGVVTSEKEAGGCVRFVLADRTVTFPYGELKRWEHVAGNPEILVISAGQEMVRVEGQQLAEIRGALDNSRIRELRECERRPVARTGPVVNRITIEPA